MMFIFSWMKKRTKKITALKKMADEDSSSSKILQTHSLGNLDCLTRSGTEDFGRFASILVRVAIFFKAERAECERGDALAFRGVSHASRPTVAPLFGSMITLGTAFLLSLLLAVSVRADPGSEGHALTVTSLHTEHQVNPVGIDVQAPCLGWQLTSSTRGAEQTAYRIQVARSEAALRAEENLVWDSGKVQSGESLHHAYEGPSLDGRTRYVWRVRVWDGNGESSPWSEPALWETALPNPSEWTAQWIEPGLNQDSSEPAPSPMLRNEFSVDGDVASARLYATSHGVYELHLNGERVGDRLFTPGWTSYEERLQYQTYDVTGLLTAGENAMGAVLGDGWYRGYIGFGGQRNYYGDTLALLAQLHVTYEDGRTAVVVRTDDGWTAATGAIRKSDIYMGETYDAQHERKGWTQPGYDDSGWSTVQEADHEMDRLFAQQAPSVRRIQEIKPKEVIVTPEGDTVLDMGQNLVGWMRMEVEGAAGTEVTLQHAEVLDKQGNFYTENLRAADQTDRFILDGTGTEVYEPHFTFHGFRYVKVSGYPGEVEPDDFTGVVLHSDMQPTGHFESSNARLNQLQHNILWGQKGNFLDIPTDCPQRDERLGWTGDIQVFARTANFNMDTAGFLRKWLRDLDADQREMGSVPHVVPNVLDASDAGAAGWADASVIVPWELYQTYGNERILETQYESMKGWVEFMRTDAARDSTQYLRESKTFGDWVAFTSGPDRARYYPGAYTNTDLISTAYFARSTDLLRRTAEILGKTDDAERYATLFEQIKEAFQEEYVTPNGRVLSDTQTSYLLALQFNLLPEEMRMDAARALRHNVEDRGHLTTGFLGTPHLNPILSEYGFTDKAYELLLRTEYPSWLYPVTMGATTIWERWNGIKPDSTFQDPGMNSFNHYAYGAIGEWLYEEVAGIEAAAPGYKEIRIAPRPGDTLTHARAFMDTGYGRVASDWSQRDGQFRLNVTIPANTQAAVRLPEATGTTVTENGTPLDKAEGIAASHQDGSAVIVEVGSGDYSFAYDTETPTSTDTTALGDDPTVGKLLTDSEARAILRDHLPSLVDSPWLSQVMGFSLERVPRAVPFEISNAALQAVRRDLETIDR